MKDLVLINKDGLLMPKWGNDIYKFMLMHFSGGSVAITADRLEEIETIALAHGWRVFLD